MKPKALWQAKMENTYYRGVITQVYHERLSLSLSDAELHLTQA